MILLGGAGSSIQSKVFVNSVSIYLQYLNITECSQKLFLNICLINLYQYLIKMSSAWKFFSIVCITSLHLTIKIIWNFRIINLTCNSLLVIKVLFCMRKIKVFNSKFVSIMFRIVWSKGVLFCMVLLYEIPGIVCENVINLLHYFQRKLREQYFKFFIILNLLLWRK